MLAVTARLRYVVIAVAAFIALATFYFALYQTPALIPVIPGSHEAPGRAAAGYTLLSPARVDDNHTITGLIETAYTAFSQRLGKRSWSLAHAAARYRERRGRHPPPGFDEWFAAAQSHSAIIVEDFFDRIHHDINPFWGVDPLEMRAQARAMPHIIRVRGGKIVHFEGDNSGVPRSDRLALWEKLLGDMLPHLPDLDMPVNLIDEPRMLVPFEDIGRYVAKGQGSRQLFPPDRATTATSLADIDGNPQPFDPEWIDDRHNYWHYVNRTCPPDSPARKVQDGTTLGPIDAVFPTGQLAYMKDGFIANFTQARDPCLQPHLRAMHGTFVEAFSMSTSTKLFPLFSGSKLPVNNELLIPAAMYLSDQTRYTGGASTGGRWADKKNGLIWRGTASGGRNQENNWWHYHRHRFVQMLNGSAVELAEGGDPNGGSGGSGGSSGGGGGDTATFTLQAAATYNVSGRHGGPLGPWLRRWSDVGFNRLDCWPESRDWLGRLRVDCPYTDPFFALVGSKPMAEQYGWKFLPDVDGNSYSARWRPFLLSTSCPLKATVYAEWHDDRLSPWLHFVPFDNTYMDIYAVVDYFLDGHDAQAQRIAEEGRDWAAKVMRKEDMMLYTWRLLLEYARVLDPNRDRLGYVGDLVHAPPK